MKLSYVSVILCLTSIWVMAIPLNGSDAQAIIERKGGLTGVLKPTSVASLSEEERLVLIDYFRGEMGAVSAEDASSEDSRIPGRSLDAALLKLGDKEKIAASVAFVLNAHNNPLRSQSVLQALSESARPEAVAMLLSGIFVDEPFISTPVEGDTGMPLPKSFGIAECILELIKKSPAFSESLRHWASESRGVDPVRALPMIRQWSVANERALREGRYSDIQPGEDLWSAERDARRAKLQRIDAFRNHLITQGLSPSSSKNWATFSEWNEPQPNTRVAITKGASDVISHEEAHSLASRSHSAPTLWSYYGGGAVVVAATAFLMLLLAKRKRKR